MFDDREIALMILQDQTGVDNEEAHRLLALDQTFPQRIRSQIEQKRAEIEAEAEAVRQREYEQSPEGRREAAMKALEAKAERARMVEGARLLLEQESGTDVSHLTDAEALRLSGVEPGEGADHNDSDNSDTEGSDAA